MAKGYSVDLRKRAVDCVNNLNMTLEKTAEMFQIGFNYDISMEE